MPVSLTEAWSEMWLRSISVSISEVRSEKPLRSMPVSLTEATSEMWLRSMTVSIGSPR